MAAVFSSDEAKAEFDIDIINKEFFPRYNLAPTQDIPVIVAGSRIFDVYKWGFIPHWAKDKSAGYRMINTKAETISEKRTFKEAFEKFRCIILTSGFYEWKNKKPFFFKLKKQKIFAFAGIATFWNNEKGEKIGTCSIITTEANKMVKKFHDRMPVILDKKQIDDWIDIKNSDVEYLKTFLKPYDSGKMQYYKVSDKVNSVKNESPDLVKEID